MARAAGTARVARAGALAMFAAVAAVQVAAAEPIRVVDGDTIRLGQERIRILGVDTPEIHGACPEETRRAAEAKGYLRGLLDGRTPQITRSGLDRYGRTLAKVSVDGRDVAQLLIAARLGRAYWGGHRHGWCG